jgi:ribose transport system substrate-binding protein
MPIAISNPRATARFIGAGALALLSALALCSCSSSTASSSEAANSSTTSGSAAGKCGTVTLTAPQDASGVLRNVPSPYLANYDGYAYPVQKSAWATWRPSKTSGFRIGVILGDTANAAQVSTLNSLKSGLKSDPAIASVSVAVSNDTLTTELQEYQTMVRQGDNLIVLQPVSTGAELPVIASAAERGIPTVVIGSQLATADAVTVAFNWEKAGAQQAAQVLSLMGGKGNVLEVQGIPGLAINNDAMAGFKSALSSCPGIKVLGSVSGEFTPTASKSAILNFLATHPQPINGVLQVGGAGQAAVTSFQQAGRPLPALNFAGALENELVLWKQLAAKGLKAVAAVQSASALGEGTAEVVNRMLAGDGIQTTAVIASWRLIQASDLASVIQPSWTQQSTASADIDSGSYFPASFINTLFANSSTGQ